MGEVRPLPVNGTVALDARGPERALRVTWHASESVVVLSLWRNDVCVGTFRLAHDDVPGVIDVLRRSVLARDRPANHRLA